MIINTLRQNWRASGRIRTLIFSAALMISGTCQGYVGNSFLNIPGEPGQWLDGEFDGWIRAEAMYWPEAPMRVFSSADQKGFDGDRMLFAGPGAPAPGVDSKLAVSLSKSNPDTGTLMRLCLEKVLIPQMTYAESSERSRPVLEVGTRPADLPEYWLYEFKGASISECPVVEEAPEQAFVISFEELGWLNADSDTKPWKIALSPTEIDSVKPAEQSSPGTRTFVITWLGVAADVSDDQCPIMNEKPTEKDYYALMSPEEAAKERVRLGERGVDYARDMGNRGPHRLSATYLPGIVRDPGFSEPVTKTAFGVSKTDTASPAANSCATKTYEPVQGPSGVVHNQLYTTVGCYHGYMGRKGYRNQTSNARRADGNVVTLIEVSEIDDLVNDDQVIVKILYGKDRPMRDAAGETFLPDATFRLSQEPQFVYYNRSLKGKIVQGQVVTDAVPVVEMNTGLQDPLLVMHDAQLQLRIGEDKLTGVLGGYLDWKQFMTMNRSSYSEQLMGFQAPGLYNALRRNADGMMNPVTGECEGISAAYEIEAVPAFIARPYSATPDESPAAEGG